MASIEIPVVAQVADTNPQGEPDEGENGEKGEPEPAKIEEKVKKVEEKGEGEVETIRKCLSRLGIIKYTAGAITILDLICCLTLITLIVIRTQRCDDLADQCIGKSQTMYTYTYYYTRYNRTVWCSDCNLTCEQTWYSNRYRVINTPFDSVDLCRVSCNQLTRVLDCQQHYDETCPEIRRQNDKMTTFMYITIAVFALASCFTFMSME